MEVSKILDEIKEYYKFKTDAEFARFLNIRPQSLSNWRSRNSFNPFLVYKQCPEINPDWILLGKRPIKKDDLCKGRSATYTPSYYSYCQSLI